MLLGIRNDLVHGYNLRLVPSFHFQVRQLIERIGCTKRSYWRIRFNNYMLLDLIGLISYLLR